MVYVAEDNVADSSISLSDFDITIAKIDTATATRSVIGTNAGPGDAKTFTSVRSLALDTKGELPVNNLSKVLIFDYNAQPNKTVKFMALDDALVPVGSVVEFGPNAGANDEATKFDANLGMMNFAVDIANDRLIVTRSLGPSKFNDGLGTGFGSLIDYQLNQGLFGATADHVLLTSFDQGEDKRIVKPTAVAINAAGTWVYLADNSRIWALDVANNYAATLLSSSNPISGDVGKGPTISANVWSMVADPDNPLLYIANGASGIVAVDTNTGDRFTIAN